MVDLLWLSALCKKQIVCLLFDFFYPYNFNDETNSSTLMFIDFIKFVFCCSKKAVIEFRDLNNLDEILHIHSVAPKKPTVL